MNENTKTCSSCFKDIDARAVRCAFCTQRQGDVPMHRDVPGKLAGGVCAAFAQHFNWDVTLVRIAFIVSVAFTGTLVLWVYAAAWAMTPFGVGEKAPLARLLDWGSKVLSPRPTELERVQ